MHYVSYVYIVAYIKPKEKPIYNKKQTFLNFVTEKVGNGNKVRAYDKERCICDIIRSKGRMDLEQVKKTIKQYMQCKDKEMVKLSEYSKKMGINKKVMEMVEGYYE